ncbi:MAG: heavy-metal-associated domain-containing protein, partial [Chloroflexales bacterium]|nr:heavy-metal-associated domain-containing protein [Chloroflexales bacterium]
METVLSATPALGWIDAVLSTCSFRHLAIEGMHCAACSLTVEEVLQRLPGVDNVQVNGASAVARVAWSPGQSQPSAWL